MSYTEDARSDARYMVEHFRREIINQLVDDGTASWDVACDYADGESFYRKHINRSYTLIEAATILDELADHEAANDHLWYDKKPRDAVITQAAYTYGNAVLWHWETAIQKINREVAKRVQEWRDTPGTCDSEEMAATRRIAEEVVSQTVTV